MLVRLYVGGEPVDLDPADACGSKAQGPDRTEVPFWCGETRSGAAGGKPISAVWSPVAAAW